MVLEQAAQRRDVAGHVVGQPGGEVAELEQLHVEVARRPGDPLQLLEAVAKDAQRLGREDAAQLALQRARAAHRDAQVVQELRVGVGERAGQVRVDRREQARAGSPTAATSARSPRSSSRRSFDDTPPTVAAERLDGVVLDRPRRRDEPEPDVSSADTSRSSRS